MNEKPDQEQSLGADDKAAAEGADNQENVDKIRDILFGGQMRDYEQRFRAMEDKITKEVTRLNNNVTSRLDQLDRFTKSELKLVTEKLMQERKERKLDGEDFDAALIETRKTLENRIADVDEVHGAAAQEIRNRIHEQANELLDTLRLNQTALETSLDKESRRLSDEKVAREDLAGLFSEVALRLQREFDLPDKK